ncbi:MAG: ABC-F family ATP-binding cassette domain-containing protein [Bdellovibrionales bacterium]
MSTLRLNQLGVFTPSPLFQNLSLTLHRAQRLGVVAQNGSGKSTLLRCIAGMQEPSAGAVSMASGTRIGFVQQEVPAAWLDQSLFDVVCSGLSAEDQSYNFWRADVLLEEFRTPQNYAQKPLKELSGGWQRLALIARAWIEEPDLLLLDEPTNHLDAEKIGILESWLQGHAGQTPMMIVSHDRCFLDACTTHTLFLRPNESKLYAHSYSTARELLLADDEARAVKLEQDKKDTNRLRAQANELKNIGINSGSDLALKKAKQLRQRASHIEGTFQELHKERQSQISLKSSDTHARVLLSLKDMIIRAPDNRALFKIDALILFQGDRLVVLGENGSGKSVFIRHLLKACRDPESVPEAKVSPTIVLGYADQHMSQLPHHKSPFDYVMERFSLGDQRTRTLLAGVGFPVEEQGRLLSDFSSGQKARLGMLALRLQEPNFYLLDEPTNHVDIVGQEKLEEEILAQNATCILVSHDRRFVETVGTRFLRIKEKKLIEEE